MFASVFKIDLIRADTEASDDNKVLGFGKDSGSELRFGPNTNDMDVASRDIWQLVGDLIPKLTGEQICSPNLLDELIFR